MKPPTRKRARQTRFFFLEGGMVEIRAAYPAGVIGSTLDNLKAAANGGTRMDQLYRVRPHRPRRRFPQIATLWDNVCVAEKQHEKRYNDLWKNLSEGRVFKRDGVVVWRCINCGYLHEAKDAPKLCPTCLHPQAYFELLGENW